MIFRGFSVTIDSDLKVGAGLGSSASFSVVLAGCFVKEITRNVTTQFSDEELCEISQWAFCSERIMHGTPSGLDNCLCTYGSIIRFRKNEEPAVLKLEKSKECAYKYLIKIFFRNLLLCCTIKNLFYLNQICH